MEGLKRKHAYTYHNRDAAHGVGILHFALVVDLQDARDPLLAGLVQRRAPGSIKAKQARSGP